MEDEELKSKIEDCIDLRISFDRRFHTEIKKHAAERHISMRQYVTEAVIEKMRRDDSYM